MVPDELIERMLQANREFREFMREYRSVRREHIKLELLLAEAIAEVEYFKEKQVKTKNHEY
jgi:hypothetical protein